MSYFPTVAATISGTVPINQDVMVSTGNSSTLNVNAGVTWSGVSASTLGVNAIQVSLKTDKNCTLYVDQSEDGINWDQIDDYEYNTAIDNFGITVQAINTYFRVRVTNLESTNTTYFRLSSTLCPIIEALPRSLDEQGNLKVGVKSIEDLYGFESENTPMGEIRVVEPVRLVGTTFQGTIVDPNFWSATTASGGTVTQSGQLILNTVASGSTSVQSIRLARYVGGTAMRYRSQIRLGDAGTANNYRRWGAFSSTDGAFFELSGTTLYVVTRKAGVDTKVAQANWNKYNVAPTLTNAFVSEIYWTNGSVYFSLGSYVHKVTAASTTWANTMSLPVRQENVSLVSTTNCEMNVRVATIARLGKIETLPGWFHGTTAASTQLKYGPGTLHRLTLNNPAGTLMSVYDSITAATNAIAIINAPKDANPVVLDYNLPFYNGLYIVTTGTWDYTCIYE